jgi:hypothetical protein
MVSDGFGSSVAWSCDADIAIKSGLDKFGLAVAKPSRNITVRGNVHLAGRGISIGSEVRLGSALARCDGPVTARNAVTLGPRYRALDLTVVH